MEVSLYNLCLIHAATQWPICLRLPAGQKFVLVLSYHFASCVNHCVGSVCASNVTDRFTADVSAWQEDRLMQ